jgi:hypothetical protein
VRANRYIWSMLLLGACADAGPTSESDITDPDESASADVTAVAASRDVICDVPDSRARSDGGDKFAFVSAPPRWTRFNLTWRLTGQDDAVSNAEAVEIARAAFTAWSAHTKFTFTQSSSSGADIQIRVEPSSRDSYGHHQPEGTGANAQRRIVINTNKNWSAATPTPLGRMDMYTVMAHEIGHALTLEHSAVHGALMNVDEVPREQISNYVRRPGHDDIAGLAVLYDSFEQAPGLARDIGVGLHGDVWKIGDEPWGDGYRIYKWVKNGWVEASGQGGATRIGVGPNGAAWVATANGSIWWHDPDPYAGGWNPLSSGCAKDIAVGPDGWPWVVGCDEYQPGNPFAGYHVYKLGLSWFKDGNVGAIAIAVDETNRPWVVSGQQAMLRRNTSALESSGWTHTSMAGFDIGVVAPENAWGIGPDLTSGGARVIVRNQQASAGTFVSGPGATWISAGPSAAWLVDTSRRTYKQIDRQRLYFSNDGAIPGMSCQQLREDADAAGTWLDNYLCSERDLGVRWSNAGPLGAGWNCWAVVEPSEPPSGTWGDNFVCASAASGLRLQWSYTGPIQEITTEAGYSITPQCVQWFEPSDPHTWYDNYLCYW